MKKLLSILLAMVMLASGMFLMASCDNGGKGGGDDEGSANTVDTYGIASTKLEDIAEKLENADYSVTLDDDYDRPGIELFLRAYNDDYDSIMIYQCSKETTASLIYKQLKSEYDHEIVQINNEIAYYEHALAEYKEDMKNSLIDEFEDELKELKKDLKETQEEYILGISGKVIWYGTKNAFEKIKPSEKNTTSNYEDEDEDEDEYVSTNIYPW